MQTTSLAKKMELIQGLSSPFSVPFASFKNVKLSQEFSLLINTLGESGVKSDIAINSKKNIYESEFNFFKSDSRVIKEGKDYFTKCLRAMLNRIQNESTHYKLRFNDSWFHVSHKFSVHDVHTHPGCSWCGIFYVEPGDSTTGHTVFCNPLQTIYMDAGTDYLTNSSAIRVKPSKGTLILFPSHIRHYQELYEGDAKRIMIGFNVSVLSKTDSMIILT